jgi:DNA-binding IscR family transcriptional regulator
LGEVIEVIEGANEENGQSSSASPDSPAVKVLTQTWKQVAGMEQDLLRNVTFAQLLERAKDQGQQMYFI